MVAVVAMERDDRAQRHAERRVRQVRAVQRDRHALACPVSSPDGAIDSATGDTGVPTLAAMELSA